MKSFSYVLILSLLAGCGRTTIRQMDSVKWKEDLHYLSTELAKEHKNLFHKVSKEEFLQAVNKLDERIPELTNQQIMVGLASIVAMVGDGHTELSLYQSAAQFHRFPLVFYFYGDSLYVTAATNDYVKTVGSRVIQIGTSPVEEALNKVKPVISHDNDMEYRHSGPECLAIPEILHALGITENDTTASFILQKMSGIVDTVEVKAVKRSELKDLKSVSELLKIQLPLYLQKSDNYWFTYLEDSKTLYLQYNRCANNDDGESIDDFAEKVFEFADHHQVDRFVVDLRSNSGGNMKLNKPIIEGISSRPSINQKGKVFVIIGRRTFSAAMNAAIDLKKNTKAIFVGEPSRGKPNGYGELGSFRLPNSDLKVECSVEYYNFIPELGDTDYFPLDVRVENSFSDYLAGRDRIMDTILNSHN